MSKYLGKMSKGVARTKQKAMEKMGKAEGTVDLRMDSEKENFSVAYDGIKRLSKDANELMVVMKQLVVAQQLVASDIHALFETGDEFYNSSLKLQDSTRFVDNAREQFESQMHEDMLEPIAVYLGQYKEMSHRIATYDIRRVDKDRYQRDLRRAQERGKYAELPHLEEKTRVAKANYLALHDELLQDLPTMAKDRLEFLPLTVATYITSYTEFFRSAAKAMAESRAMIDSIDRQAVHGYPPCITPLEDSAVKNFTTLSIGGADHAASGGADSDEGADGVAAAASAPKAAPKAAPKVAPKRAPPMPAAKSSKPTATGLFDFEAQEDNELPFRKGDVLTITSQDGDWWDAELNGASGMIPANYVKLN